MASNERHKETAERWVSQLQQMIDDVGRHAGPVLRDVAAKAAELAAVAGEKAGPAAHKAATVTEQVGGKLAVKSKVLAADLHASAEKARAQAARPKASGDVGGSSEPGKDGPQA